MASFTVQFDDGSSHVYDNVPEHVTEADVQDRAANDFSGKAITGVSMGAGSTEPSQEAATSQFPEQAAALAPVKQGLENAVGAIQTAGQVAKDVASSPLGVAAESIYGAKKFLVDPILNRLPAAPGAAPGPVAPSAPQIQVPQSVGGGPRPAVSPGAQQTFNALKQPVPTQAPVAAPAAAEQPGVIQRGMDMASKMRRIAAERVIQPGMQAARAAAPMAAAAVPAAALAGAAQQAGAADINNPGANIFAAPAAAGKQFADWANTVFGSEERYKKIREAQRAGLTGQ